MYKKIYRSLLALGLLMGIDSAEAKIVKGAFERTAPKMGIIEKRAPVSVFAGGMAEEMNVVQCPLSPKGLTAHQKAAAPTASLKSDSFGFLTGADGSQWFYTQTFTEGENYSYSSSTITVYDGNHKKKGEFSVNIPEGRRVNDIQPYGTVTNRLFDFDATTYEVMVYQHEVTPDYVGKEYVQIYNLNGEMVREFVGNGMIVESAENEWTVYRRFLLTYGEGKDTKVEFYRPATWGETTCQLEHTMTIEDALINYIDAPFLNFYNDNGKPYYVLTHYEKCFDVRDEDGNMVIDETTYLPYFTPDNTFVVETYDKNWEKVNEFSIPTDAPDGVMVRMMGVGAFSDMDITRGYFSGDDKLNYIVMYEDTNSSWETEYSFNVYGENGRRLRTMCDHVGDYWNCLSSVPGNEDQWIFLQSADDGSQQLMIVETPSCEPVQLLPAQVAGKAISTNMDRVYDHKTGEYQYVVAINEADVDEAGNVIAVFGYYDKNFNLDHYVRINLGPNAQTFTPLVNAQTLNPFLFNTDDQREYIFFSKVKNPDGSGSNVLFVANDEGKVIETFGGRNSGKGDIWTAALLRGTEGTDLFVNYYDYYASPANTMDFYALPFNSFAGSGTQEDPYLIKSLGDLQQVKQHPKAYYEITNDIDARGMSVAIPEFGGVLDGRGHTISNLLVRSNDYYGGIFGTLNEALIVNMELKNVTVDITSANSYFGTIAGFTTGSTISYVSVEIESLTGSHVESFGGLVGQATGYSNIAASDVWAKHAYLSSSNNVGGIVGELRTSSSVTASAFSGQLEGNVSVGGIAGRVGNGCDVTDCHNNALISGRKDIGGIAGTIASMQGSRGLVERCVNDGLIIAEANCGGIVGKIESDWLQQNATVVRGCITKSLGEVGETKHHIAGFTIADDNYEPGEPVLTEKGLKSNYVLYAEDADDADYVQGKSIDLASQSVRELAESLGYKFGEGEDAPWSVMVPGLEHVESSGLLLFFEYGSVAGIESVESAAPSVVANGIYNLSGQRVSVPEKGIVIVGGKKILVK